MPTTSLAKTVQTVPSSCNVMLLLIEEIEWKVIHSYHWRDHVIGHYSLASRRSVVVQCHLDVCGEQINEGAVMIVTSVPILSDQ